MSRSVRHSIAGRPEIEARRLIFHCEAVLPAAAIALRAHMAAQHLSRR